MQGEKRCSFCATPISKSELVVENPHYLAPRCRICSDCIAVCVEILIDSQIFQRSGSFCVGECR